MDQSERLIQAIEKQAKATAQLAEAVAILIAEMADPEQDGESPSIPQSLSVRPTDG